MHSLKRQDLIIQGFLKNHAFFIPNPCVAKCNVISMTVIWWLLENAVFLVFAVSFFFSISDFLEAVKENRML